MTNESFRQALDYLRSLSHNKSEQGSLFEKLIKSFLKTDGLYQGRFNNIWLWREWARLPENAGKIEILEKTDMGIDLVAEETDGTLCAIQCKFYSDTSIITKKELDSFFEIVNRKSPDGTLIFPKRLLVYTGAKYGKIVDKLVSAHNCQLLSFESLANSPYDWPDLAKNMTAVKKRAPYKLREHQKAAFDRVVSGFKKYSRGQMIMACGTGKTFTSLKIAERVAGKSGTVLYLVPSISLMHQSIREWSEQRHVPHSYIGVCSDTKVGKNDEDVSLIEMEIPVTTDESKIARALKSKSSSLLVVFSTYQSIMAVSKAQKKAKMEFDIVMCDEAHRTTGADASGKKNEVSPFIAVHDDRLIKTKKRLYMTATSKVYGDIVKSKARQKGVGIYSMDDHAKYGDVFYELTFSQAIKSNLLTDYRVLILQMDKRFAASYVSKFPKEQQAVRIIDVSKMIGIWKALQLDEGSDNRQKLQTGIAFSNSIKDSKWFAANFENITRYLNKNNEPDFECKVQHVDGRDDALNRAKKLNWLEDSDHNQNTCHILSNARCLSEGVDVPSLDAVIFVAPKYSQIDVIQAVGRVMRKSANKKYGYIIIPVVVPDTEDPDEILGSDAYDVVWGILRALRSHDDRLNIQINQADLNKKIPKNIKLVGMDQDGTVRTQEDSESIGTIPAGSHKIPADAIYAKLVDKVGSRRYLETWAKDVASIVGNIDARINSLRKTNPIFEEKFIHFHNDLKNLIKDKNEGTAISMISQHMVTLPIFEKLFGSQSFETHNSISRSMNAIVDDLRKYGLEVETEDLRLFYEDIGERVRGITDTKKRQIVIKEFYEKFFKSAIPRLQDKLGIVYTPIEVVDFILRSADYVLKRVFDRSLSDKNINIIDPFTGTGSFIARLMDADTGFIRDGDIARKYKKELHANEIVLLAYYIAAVNSELVYRDRTGDTRSFNGLVLHDTFYEKNMDDFTKNVFSETEKQFKKQREIPITVIACNPPYSSGPKIAGEDKNTSYPELDQRIKDTFILKGSTTAPKNLYDSYIRSLRWMSDRIGRPGVIAVITNASFLKSDTGGGDSRCICKRV